MAIVTVGGEVGCRWEEVARLAALRLQCEFIGEPKLAALLAEEFGSTVSVPERAWAPAALSILSRIAADEHLVVAVRGAESLFGTWPGVSRVYLIAREAYRTGSLMLDAHLERPAALELLKRTERAERQQRKLRFGRATPAAETFDLLLNAEAYHPDALAALIEAACEARGVFRQGLLSHAAEAQIQFQVRLQLARHGITPAGKARLEHKSFGHPSEEMFANLLDFYGIAWEYEPRSFPLQWDKDGHVTEAFTPDFYLPDFDVYVELTTMKQALVTKKNRKVKLLRAIYPHINIQVFYGKDFEDLVMKYGLSERAPA